MSAYADTNFFTRWFLPLPDSDEARSCGESAQLQGDAPLPITWLHRAEFVNALQLHVFFGKQPGHVRVTTEQAASALETFRTDAAAGQFLNTVPMAIELLDRLVEELSLRHTARHGFRTYDLLHVASALLLGCDTFWSFDERTLKLAKLEGLKVPVGRRK